MPKPRTLVLVEGMKPAEDRLAPIFAGAGYRVVTVRTKKSALTKVQETHPSIIVVDIPSLRFDGARLCSALGEICSGVPLLVLLASGSEAENGTDGVSYLWHPFSTLELIDRTGTLLSGVLQVGDVIFNVDCATVVYSKQKRRLTPKQAQLLELLMRHPGQVLTRAFLMKQVWDTDYLGDTRTLDVHISWLRKAIEEDPSAPVYLRTVRGVGYCFEDPER